MKLPVILPIVPKFSIAPPELFAALLPMKSPVISPIVPSLYIAPPLLPMKSPVI